MMIREVCLIRSPVRKMGCAGFAEIRECHGLRDTRTLGRFFEYLRDHPVAHRFGLREPRPRGRSSVVRCWMAADTVGCKRIAHFGTPGCRIVPRSYSRQYEPPLHVRNRERHRQVPLLLLDSGLETVLVVDGIADSEVLALSMLDAGIELVCNIGNVAGGLDFLYYQEDSSTPIELVRRPRRWAVVAGEPVHRVQRFTAVLVAGPAIERVQSDPVVPIGPLVVLIPVDPADNRLRSMLSSSVSAAPPTSSDTIARCRSKFRWQWIGYSEFSSANVSLRPRSAPLPCHTRLCPVRN